MGRRPRLLLTGSLHVHRIILAVALLASIGGTVAPSASRAQPSFGNRANGFDYQPTPGEVRPLERRDGVAPTPSQAAATRRTVRRLNHELLGPESAQQKRTIRQLDAPISPNPE